MLKRQGTRLQMRCVFNSTVPIQAIECLTKNSLKDEIYAFFVTRTGIATQTNAQDCEILIAGFL